jgi:PEGA domain
MGTPRKVKPTWGWENSVVALLLCINLCAFTWFLWALPENFDRTSKVISTVASWVVSLLAFFGVKKATTKTSFAEFLSLPPVGLCTLAITVGVWLFILPIHGVTVSVVAAGSYHPVPDAAVTLDDKKLLAGADGKVRANSLLAASYRIKVESDGYDPQETTVAFEDVLRNRNIPVALHARRGTVKATSNPSDAAVYLDGDKETLKGQTPFTQEMDPGRHTIRFAKAGYQPTAWEEFEIQRGRQTELPLRALQRQAGAAKEYPVLFASDPSGAALVVDGKAWGTTPSQVPLTLGQHTVRYKLGSADCGPPKPIKVPPYAVVGHLDNCGKQP